MPTAARHKLVIEAGAFFKRVFTVRDKNDERISLDEYTLRSQFQLDYDPDGEATAIDTFFEDNARLIPNHSLKEWTWYIPASETEDYDFDAGVWDLEYVPVSVVQIPFAGGYTQAAIDVTNGSSRGVIAADGGTPFSGVVAGNLIRISASENGHEGSYVVFSASGTEIQTTLPLAGTDNAADTAILIEMLTPDQDNVVRLVQGPLVLSREVT